MNNRKTSDLTFEKANELFRYAAEKGVLERRLKSGRWKICGHKPRRGDGRGQVNVDGETYLAHRLVWLLVYGEWPENEIDHLDRNPMNNRIDNLRVVTRTGNNQNHGLHRNNSSGYPGVYFDKHANKYKAQIKINRKRIHLGLFATAEEAFINYMLAKIELHPSSPDAQEYLRELTLAG